jgi:hypothetical protein
MKRFVLEKRTAQVRERAGSLTVAVALTAGLAFVSMRGAPSLVRLLAGGDTLDVLPTEELRYLAVIPADDTRVARSAFVSPSLRRPAEVTSPAATVASPLTVPAPVGAARSGDKDPDPRPHVPWTPPGRSYRDGRTTAPTLGHFPGTRSATAETMDSVLWKLERSVPYHPYVPPTLAERDAMMREEAKHWADAREQQRPIPVTAVWGLFMPGLNKKTLDESRSAAAASGGGLGLPLLSPGPSTARRRRDSAIHAGNLLRLQRLADLAKARQDSLRRMDSIAMLGKP